MHDPTGDWVIRNGRLLRADDAAVRVTHPGFRYGFGLFETLLAVHGRGVCIGEHLARMRQSARWLKLRGVPASAGVARGMHALYEARRGEGVSARDLEHSMARIFLSPAFANEPRADWTMSMEPIAPAERRALARGVESAISRWVQPSTHPLVAHKTLAYLDRFLTTREARAAGHFDHLRLDERGCVAEGSLSSVFVVRGGELITPPTHGGILPGVTSARVLALARAARVRVSERAIPRAELDDAEEVFLTNSTKGVIPIVRLDGKRVGKGKAGRVTRRLQRALAAETARLLAGQ